MPGCLWSDRILIFFPEYCSSCFSIFSRQGRLAAGRPQSSLEFLILMQHGNVLSIHLPPARILLGVNKEKKAEWKTKKIVLCNYSIKLIHTCTHTHPTNISTNLQLWTLWSVKWTLASWVKWTQIASFLLIQCGSDYVH